MAVSSVWIRRVGLLATVALVLGSCTGGETPRTSGSGGAGGCSREQTLIVDIDSGRAVTTNVWNPYLPGVQLDQGFFQTMIEPLFIYSLGNDETYPWLAESMTPNARYDEWTLKLRPGVKWSDGEAFTADDVLFTIETLIDNAPEMGQLGESSSMAEWVERVEKVDDLAIHFSLKNPNPRFQANFTAESYSSIHVLPKHIWEGQDPLTFKNYDPSKGWPIFTGPYTLKSVTPNRVEWQRDDDWWGAQSGFMPLPKPQCIVFVAPGSVETKAALMSQHQLDSIMDIDPGTFEAIKAKNPKVIAWHDGPPWAWVDNCVRNLELNLTVEPWNDPTMRWALSYAINREQVVQLGYENTTTTANGILPDYPPLNRYIELAKSAGLYDQYPLGEYNPERAKQLIESNGYTLNDNGYYEKDGKELSLQIETTSDFIEYQHLAEVVVEQLQNFGINATLHLLSTATLEENYAVGNYEATVLGWSTCASVVEPWSSLDTLTTRWLRPIGKRAGYNGMRWDNAEYSAIVSKMGQLAPGTEGYDELFLQAWKIFLSELPVIPITQARKLVPFDTEYWVGWPTADDPYLQPTMWWQNAHIIIHHLEPASSS